MRAESAAKTLRMSSFRRHVGVKVVLVFVLLATFAGCATPTKKGLGNGDAVAEGTVKKTGEVVDALKKLENLVKALEALIVTDAEAMRSYYLGRYGRFSRVTRSRPRRSAVSRSFTFVTASPSTPCARASPT